MKLKNHNTVIHNPRHNVYPYIVIISSAKEEEIKDNQGVSIVRKLKRDIQYKNKTRTNNDLQNTTQNKDRTTRTTLKMELNAGVLEG